MTLIKSIRCEFERHSKLIVYLSDGWLWPMGGIWKVTGGFDQSTIITRSLISRRRDGGREGGIADQQTTNPKIILPNVEIAQAKFESYYVSAAKGYR